jgi:phosphatidate cytidylyltransferase
VRPLLLRLLSAAVLIPLVISSAYLGGRIFAAMIAFACIVMIFEWTRMVEGKECSASFYALAFGATAAMFAAPSGAYGLAFAISALSGVVAFFLAKRNGGAGIWPALGVVYILMPSVALMWLRLDSEYGRALTLMLFFVVWAADTGAFVTGKLIGGPKISYALSPSKTWAGIVGGVIGGSLIGAAAAYLFFGPGAAWAYFLLGGVLGAASVAGDLAESAVKRKFGVKDISGFIPGHGGALDRMDGMIFATIAMTGAYFLYMLTEMVQG